MDTTDHDWHDPVPGFSPAIRRRHPGSGYRISRAIGVAAELWLAALPGKPVRRDISGLLPDIGDPWRAFAVCGAPG